MYISFRENLSNEWTPKTVCESCADWLKFEDLSNRDPQVVFYFLNAYELSQVNIKAHYGC